MLDHEVGQHDSVDQDDPCVHLLGIAVGVGAELAGRDEDTAVSLRPVESTDEALNIGATDRAIRGVSLRLDIDAIEPEPILLNDPVESPSPVRPRRSTDRAAPL